MSASNREQFFLESFYHWLFTTKQISDLEEKVLLLAATNLDLYKPSQTGF